MGILTEKTGGVELAGSHIPAKRGRL